MEREVTYMDCPAYKDAQGHARCGLPAEVERRYTIDSTDGPLESALIRCPLGHWFNGPVESLRGYGPGPGPRQGPASVSPPRERLPEAAAQRYSFSRPPSFKMWLS